MSATLRHNARPYFAAVLMLFSVAIGASAQAAAPTSQRPSRWMFHDFIVELNSMPRSYTCDQLWYKFRDTLQAIGAQPTEILAYDCARDSTTRELSPRVELKFQLPDRLLTSQARWADLDTTVQSVEFAPGTLPSLSASDCDLVQHVNTELIQPLGIPVAKATFQCNDPHPTYDLVLKADKPVVKRRILVNKGA